MTTTHMPAITQRVQDMYTRFPYPPPGAISGIPITALMDYNRHIFGPSRPGAHRAAGARCRLGHRCLCRDHCQVTPEIEVVGIDLSETSLAHARTLAEDLGVGNNLELRQLPIEEERCQSQSAVRLHASPVASSTTWITHSAACERLPK